MSERSDPERLLAEALRAQAIRAPLTESTASGAQSGQAAQSAQPVANPAADPAADPATDPATETGLPTDRLLGLLSGSDHQHELLSGRGPETTNPNPTGPVIGSFRTPSPNPAVATGPVAGSAAGPAVRPNRPPVTGTTRLPSVPAGPSVWWFLLLAVLLGLAAGVIAGLFTLF